jgi:hypothetical protein
MLTTFFVFFLNFQHRSFIPHTKKKTHVAFPTWQSQGISQVCKDPGLKIYFNIKAIRFSTPRPNYTSAPWHKEVNLLV